MTRLFSRVSSAFRYFHKLPPPWVNANLFERTYLVRAQTIRTTSDKDDGWLFACSSLAHRIFDIGTNIGQAAILELLPDSVDHVLLVDPNPMALSIAAENLIVNGLINRVNLERVFVSDEANQVLDFYTVLYGAAGSMFKSHAKTASKRNLHFKVSTTTIDLLVGKYGVPDFIKIDIEGAESFALKGARECMRLNRTRFLVEMHSSSEMPMVANAQRVLETCAEVGYSAWYLSNKVILTSPEQLKDRGRCHLLLQPKDWEWPKTIIQIPQNAPLDSALYHSIMGLELMA